MAKRANRTDGRPRRNEACPCGSGRKVKRCCGLRRGPSESDLARAWLAEQARPAARLLRRCEDDTLADLIEEVVELPTDDLSLQLPLPRLLPPELEHARTALAEGDAEGFLDALPAAVARVDTWPVRAGLARAVLARRDAGALGAELAAAAIIELDSSSRRFLAASLLEALAVDAGTAPTPGGLVVAAS